MVVHTYLDSFFFILLFATFVHSKTDSPDVSALNVMYTSLNSPSSLKGWKTSGGDPCGDSWDGITCSGSSVTEIRLSGLGLSGSLGYQLSNLNSVTNFDVSNNNLNNDIPYQLPPNLQHLDLSKNQFTGSMPYSVSQMTDLNYLDLGHNKIKGQLSEMFGKLTKLKMMDLSDNQFSGDLPQSFSNLTSLSTLYMQNNQFTGKINVLADLPLDDLNVEDNKFTGWVPNELKDVAKTDGNKWSTGPAPPPPPGAHSKAKRSSDSEGGDKTATHGIVIAAVIIGPLVLIAVLVVVFSKKRSTPSALHYLEDEDKSERNRSSFTPLTSQELSGGLHTETRSSLKGSHPSATAIDVKPLRKSTSTKSSNRVSFSEEFATRLNSKRSTSVRAVSSYALADLQTATSNFDTDRLIGEGSIGRVYKAKYPDGKVLAVKKIDSSLFQGDNAEEFSEIVTSISRVHHSNTAELVGYCSEQGHNLLLYDYYRNGSLNEFLHLSDDFSRPLTWNTRVRIALGVARAVEYLHEIFSPPIMHKNIKSSNILLDHELSPRLSDYGLANFHLRTSQNLGVGYNAPECTKPSAYTLKSDVYSFGVVMLELLTGRMPYDSKRPKAEQSLVRWALPQLHDIEALNGMVDPALRGLYPPKALSRFADIIALCLQMEPEFRPQMSEVVQSLMRLAMNMKDDLSSSCRTEDEDY
ncbi:hypothetical protein ACFE04_021374 [Oxalis oulophora]